MAEKKKILYIVEAMGGGVFTYIVDLANELVNKYDMYIAYTGENGFVCSSIDEYVHAIRNAKNNSTNVITESAYHDITCLYNTKKMAEQYEKIYEE